jgi:hypothetical protein
MTLKTARDYADELAMLAENDIASADSLTMGIASNYSYKNTEYGLLEVAKADYIKKHLVPDKDTGKIPPNARIESMWDGTEDGMKMLLLHRELQSLKAIMKAIDSHSFNMRSEISLNK